MKLDDGSLLVLANLDVVQPYVFKLSQEGEVLWKTLLSQPYYRAAARFIVIDGKVYFTALTTDGTNGSFLLEVDVTTGGVQQIKILEDITYILSVSTVNDGFIVQSYDSERRRSVITRFDENIEEEWQETYPIYEDLEIPTIYNHVTGRSKPLPFFCGELNDGQGYYFNGFANYNFGLNFVSAADGEGLGVIQGNRYDAAISGVEINSDGSLALSRFGEDGRNYLTTNLSVSNTDIIQGTEIEGELILGWEDRTIIEIKSLVINDQNVIMYLGSTKSGDLELRIYSEEGLFLANKYLGGSGFVGYGNIESSDDGGIVIVSQSALEDQFYKIGFYKIGPVELEKLMN